MTHVREQMRNAVKGVLATVPGIQTVCSVSRLGRDFQRNEYPVAAVGVSENISTRGRNAPGSRPSVRQMQVVVSLGIKITDDAEDQLDALAIPVEKALADPEILGIGPLIEWQFNSASHTAVQGEEILAILELSYTGSISTLESEPETNLFANQ